MRIAVDTNILVRIVTADNMDLAARAKKLIERYGSKEVFVAYGAILEAYYVFKKFYDYTEKEAVSAVYDMLRIEQLSFEHEIAIRLALSKCAQGFAFPDALFGEIAGLKNLKTYTFDKGLKNNKNFELV